MKTRFIAEVSSNHNRNLERCINFIDIAAEIGCDVVKFQLFKIKKMFAPEILYRSKKHRDREKWELPDEFIPILSKRAQKNGISFSCTPFDLESVDLLEPYVDFFKIASYELLWSDLLIKCANTKKDIILSTGMANMEEIYSAIKTLRENGCKNPTLLHCISSYPTPISECNLSAISKLRDAFNCNIGWSDHSSNEAVLYRAVHKWGASDVEFHLDLEGNGEEFGSGHCWLPEDIKRVIENIKSIKDVDGNGDKFPSFSELSDRDWRADPIDGLRPLKKLR